MNLAFKELSIDDFRYNLRFLEKKRNLIMDGDFVKVVYSDESTAINSLFFVCPLKIKQQQYSEPNEKCTVWFSPYESTNEDSIQRMIQYEQVLIEEYKTQMMSKRGDLPAPDGAPASFCKRDSLREPAPDGAPGTFCKKTPMFPLKTQLLSGNTRMYKLPYVNGERTNTQILIKISGVWESNENYGITYKFIEVFA